MSAPSQAAKFLLPLSRARLWVTLLWALTLSVGLAGLDWAERQFFASASGQTILLLPNEVPDEAQRQAMRQKLAHEPGMNSVQWRSPADLTRQVSRRFPQPQWQGLFPVDEGWLPWVLQVRPADPLEGGGLIRDFIARREQEGSWRLILWDFETIQSLARQRLLVRSVAGFWLLLVALSGMAALLRLEWPAEGRWPLLAWSALLGLLGPGAVWAASLLAGEGLDDRCLAVALAAGFILATLVAPVLRQPKRTSLSVTLSEDPHERAWQDSGSGQ